jgi:hypothetical protein
MTNWDDIDKAEKDKSIHSKDLPTLLEYRRELDRVATSFVEKHARIRWEILHKLVCDLIEKLEARDAENRILTAKETLHKEQIGDGHQKHMQSQRVARWTLGIAAATLVVVTLAFVHGLMVENCSPAIPTLPPLSNTSAPIKMPPALTNASQANFALQTNPPPQIQEPKKQLGKASP